MLSRCCPSLRFIRSSYTFKRNYEIILGPGPSENKNPPDLKDVFYENDYFKVLKYPEMKQEHIDSIKQALNQEGVDHEKIQMLDRLPKYLMNAKKWNVASMDVDHAANPEGFEFVNSIMKTLYDKCLTAQEFDQKQHEILKNIAQKIHDTPELYRKFVEIYRGELVNNMFHDKIEDYFSDFTRFDPPKAGTFDGDVFYAYMWSYKRNSVSKLRHAISVLSYLLQTNTKVYECASMAFDRYHKLKTRTVEVEIITPSQINESEAEFYKNLVINSLEFQGNYEFKLRIDPSICKGYILKVEGRAVDCSHIARQNRLLEAFNLK